MEEKLKLSPDSFEPLAKGEAQDNEKIAAPSLTFKSNTWINQSIDDVSN